MSIRTLVVMALGCVVAWPSAPVSGASRDWADALTGRLKHINATRMVRIGYRENAIPFSYLGAHARPVGYTMDICNAIVATIAEEIDEPSLAVEYVRVTAQDRIERVASGAVDLECGSTTNTAERRRQVAFSPTIFVTGTRLAVTRASSVRSANDLRGRTVIVVRGTTNEAAMREIDRLRALSIKFIGADGYGDALAMLERGDGDALAADEVLLRGLLAETGKSGNVRIVGEMLSFERYGVVYPKDDAPLADAVERTLRALAESREIVWIYNRWLLSPLPSGQRIGLPMNDQLRRSLELIGLPPD
jgi:glutamate/aspartate transport system substrate-binding protein